MLKSALSLGLALSITTAATMTHAATTEIQAPGPQGPLAGTLESPAQPIATVLIIPGSGPTDRDGNNPLGVRAEPYKLLAEGLAANRIATVRIDKRGLFGSAKAVANPNAVTVDDYVQDTLSWVNTIRQQTSARCVWLLGHSEGGLMALATAARHPDGVCGLILVSTGGRPLGDVLSEQLHANPVNAHIADAGDAAILSLTKGERVDVKTLPAPLAPLFAPAVQGFLISLFSQDPAKLIADVRVPTLIVQGERDLQVGLVDAQRLKQAQPAATLALLPDTNHVLKTVTTGERAANIATYGNPSLSLAPGVVSTIARYIASVTTTGKAPPTPK
ncbi:alpha/beta hydrolase [Pandoraea norimbergensis]|uniref:Hydrolase n=1 Tax=Pandoraea norimbergensis TaxID=93219 RepID=A0ABM5WHU2_9BURK|nr:alpha/beta fold hydrolase [Pandoraea norimbergensis]ALS59770.1 hydrolase [Pandoraea norimbergensis]